MSARYVVAPASLTRALLHRVALQLQVHVAADQGERRPVFPGFRVALHLLAEAQGVALARGPQHGQG